MRGEPLALPIKGRTKTQRAPSDILRLLFPSLKILLTPLYSINNNGIFGGTFFAFLRLGGGENYEGD